MINAHVDARVVVFVGPGQAELHKITLPELGPQDVLVEARASLISAGTERKFLMGSPVYPYYPGYSLVGQVLAVGDAVTRFRAGDRVSCVAAHASHCVAHEAFVLPIPHQVDDEAATFFHVGATALYAVRKAQIRLGEPVAILGQGLIGLLANRIASLTGALPVIGLCRNMDHYELARSFGADIVLDTRQSQYMSKILRGLSSGGPAAIIELTNSKDVVDLAVELIGLGGRIVLAGGGGRTFGTNVLDRLWRKGASLIGGFVTTSPFRSQMVWLDLSPGNSGPRLVRDESRRIPESPSTADDGSIFMQMMALGRIAVGPLISHRYGAKETPSAFQRLLQPGALAIILQWHSA
ncbi:MAG: zinc-binding alcohol dehydrogenase [Gammaproteobacteria bacterium]|jgi:2-desacetyl-2-hydroxyethyl bacteriochlorophyllide A dehydrogenase|nr:zinc-binding alcohol dehydrogenase [Gammaproteobacteria bacterium]